MPPSIENDVRACLNRAMSIAAQAGVRDADLVVTRRRRSFPLERLPGAWVPDALANGCGFAILTVG